MPTHDVEFPHVLLHWELARSQLYPRHFDSVVAVQAGLMHCFLTHMPSGWQPEYEVWHVVVQVPELHKYGKHSSFVEQGAPRQLELTQTRGTVHMALLVQ